MAEKSYYAGQFRIGMFVLILISSILITLAYFQPWWMMSFKATYKDEHFLGSGNFWLRHNEIALTNPSTHSALSYTSSDIGFHQKTEKVFDATFIFYVFGVALTIFTFMLALLYCLGYSGHKHIVIAACGAAFMCLLSAAYFAIALPSAMQNDGVSAQLGINGFSGSNKGVYQVHALSIFSLIWGPSIGWYLAIFSGIGLIFAAIFALLSWERVSEPSMSYAMFKSS